MRVLLMHPDRDFGLDRELPRQVPDLVQDLELNTLFDVMADNDGFLLSAARTALLSSLENDVGTIRYRQEVLKDCIRNQALVTELYGLTLDAIEARRKSFFGIFGRSPGGILGTSLELLRSLIEIIGRLRSFADRHEAQFGSRGFTRLFTMVQTEFSDEYLAAVRDHLIELKFRNGLLVSAELGKGNEGTNYVLRQMKDKTPDWIKWILGKRKPGYTFHIHPRDEVGGRVLSSLRDRGINQVANAVAQSTEHIMNFFQMFRAELAFYIGCLNLYARLVALDATICFPVPEPAGSRTLRFTNLYDICLLLHTERGVIGNTLKADGKKIIVITGANRGGKSTFLRSVGLAQLMMQSGMFVAAEAFEGEICNCLLTHYKREEDEAMEKGKLDEELSRMSEMAGMIVPNTVMLFNESFGATNEREGSEIARQIVLALSKKNVKVFFVTHLYEFAHGLWQAAADDTLFLRAERLDNGRRTFKLEEGEPLQTGFGIDLYNQIFQRQNETSDQARVSAQGQMAPDHDAH